MAIRKYYQQMLNLIRKYDKSEYNELMHSDSTVVLDHLDWLEENYPTIEQFEEEYCKGFLAKSGE